MYTIIDNPDPDKLLNGLPKTIYKYLDWNNKFNRRVIQHNELFFSSPRNFNDPFDCKIEKRFDLMTDEEISFYLERLIRFKSKSEMLNWSEFEIKSVVERLKKENDFKDIEKVVADNEYIFKNDDNFYAVFCASRRWDNIPMWGYYGGNHRGICVGLNVRKIYYSGKAETGGNVIYGDYPTVIPNQPYYEMSAKRTYHKAKDWAHEEEFRLMTVSATHQPSDIVYDDSGHFKGIVISAEQDWFSEILLGVNISPKEIEDVISSSKSKIQNGTKIYKLKRVPFQFKLIKEEIVFT